MTRLLINHRVNISFFCCAFSVQRALRMALLAYFLITSSLVLADAQDTVNVIAGVSRTMDDNFFRQPASVAPVSETITTSYATLSFNKQYSLQRLNFEYTLRNNAYQNYSSLDFVANNYKGSWAWSFTPRLTGTVSTMLSETPIPFLDATFASKPSILTNEVQNVVMDWAAMGGVHFLGGFTRSVALNSSNFQQNRGNTTDSIDLGVKYAFSSGSELTMMQHQRLGEFAIVTVGLPQSFSENETEAKLNWRLSAKSSVNSRLGFVERKHDQAGGIDYSSRDYADWVGDANVSWAPTAKLQFTAAVASAISMYQGGNANYARTNSLNFNSTFAVTPKVLVSGSASLSKRMIEGTGTNPTDTIENASLSVDWTPRSYVSLGARLQRMSRTSSEPGRDFVDLMTILSANINF
jgi:exopolysaccharide biosynthesis operon protein EpsL